MFGIRFRYTHGFVSLQGLGAPLTASTRGGMGSILQGHMPLQVWARRSNATWSPCHALPLQSSWQCLPALMRCQRCWPPTSLQLYTSDSARASTSRSPVPVSAGQPAPGRAEVSQTTEHTVLRSDGPAVAGQGAGQLLRHPLLQAWHRLPILGTCLGDQACAAPAGSGRMLVRARQAWSRAPLVGRHCWAVLSGSHKCAGLDLGHDQAREPSWPCLV